MDAEQIYRPERYGSGPHLVLLHGFGFDNRVWDRMIPGLSAGFTVHLLELPGFGDNRQTSAGSLGDMAVSVRDYLDEQQIERCLLVGHSMGGYIAAEFYARFSARLAGLCLFHSTVYADSEEKKQGRRKNMVFIGEHGAAAFYKTMLPGLFFDKERNAADIDACLERSRSADQDMTLHYLSAMIARRDLSDAFREGPAPVLFILGKEDNVIPLEVNMKQVLLPDTGKLLLVDHCGHAGMLEKPAECMEAVTEFAGYCFSFGLS